MKKVLINEKEYEVYADVEFADNYFNASFGSSWQELDEETKAKLLVTATRSIDKCTWRGVKLEEEQYLEFPRFIAGKHTDDDLVMRACCEEAFAIYKSGSSETSNTDGIKTMRVQDTEITFKDSSEESLFKSNFAEEMLKRYMFTGVSVIY